MPQSQLENIDRKVVEGFGKEWQRFDQAGLSDAERGRIFAGYFNIFPWSALPPDAVGMDVGCGSGRWAKLVAPRVGLLHCADPSPAALEVARRNLSQHSNCRFHMAAADSIPLPDGSVDFAYSLGVLHHVPNTQDALTACAAKLKKGMPFLVYLYYSFENRPSWFRMTWKCSNGVRLLLSRAPFPLRYVASQIIALTVYWPLARVAGLLEKIGLAVDSLPLSFYRNRSFYVMRTDALDRFGTRLEKRFSRQEIQQMMENAGLEKIIFNDRPPFWCAVGFKK